jgi:hypothetical protein
MDYLLVSKINEFYQWQNELLIESFIQKNLISNLKLSFFADTLSDNLKHMVNTAFQGIPIYQMPDHGFEFGYSKANIFFSISNLISNNELKSSFALLESDVVLHKPFEDSVKTEFSSVLFSSNSDFNYKKFMEEIPNFKDIFDVTDDFLSDNWISMGAIIVFNNIKLEFFNVLTEHIAYVALKQYRLNNKVHEKTYKIMLAIMLMKNKSELYMSYLPDCESHMRDNNDNFNFIHYKNGFPPFFHKFMFSNSSLNYGDPFELLRVNPSTYASYYMHNLAGSYLNKIGKKLEPVLLI